MDVPPISEMYPARAILTNGKIALQTGNGTLYLELGAAQELFEQLEYCISQVQVQLPQRRRIVQVLDKYEMKFVSFFREGRETAKIYYDPSQASKVRLGRLLAKLHEQKRMTVWSNPGNKGRDDSKHHIYRYQIKQGE